jgi:hypothetical protein
MTYQSDGRCMTGHARPLGVEPFLFLMEFLQGIFDDLPRLAGFFEAPETVAECPDSFIKNRFVPL